MAEEMIYKSPETFVSGLLSHTQTAPHTFRVDPRIPAFTPGFCGGDGCETQTTAKGVSGIDLRDCGSCDHNEYDSPGKILVVHARFRSDRSGGISDALLRYIVPLADIHCIDISVLRKGACAMDLRLQQERMEYYACVLDRTVEDVFISDVVVPDTMEDVGEVLFADGDFCLWRLDLSTGSAEAEGEWKGSVCYLSENDRTLRHFPVSVGIRLRAHDDAIEPNVRPYTSFCVSDVSVQLLNTRKARVKIRVVMTLQGYAPQAMDLTVGFENAPEDVFYRTAEHCFSSITDVSEQVFTAAGNASLREAPFDRRLLSSHSVITTDLPQQSGSRAILHGTIRTSLLYQTGEQAPPIAETIETAFSQLLDLDNLSEDDALHCTVQLTSAELSIHDNAELETQFHIVVQTLCMRSRKLQCVSDAYSVQSPLSLETEPVRLTCGSIADTVQVVASASLPRESERESFITSFANVRSVRNENGAVSGAVEMKLLVRDESGSLSMRTQETEFDHTLPNEAVLLAAEAGQTAASNAGGEMQIRVPILLRYQISEQVSAEQIVSVTQSESEKQPVKRASVTLIPRDSADDLWEVAKKYGSSTEAIRKANAVAEDDDPPAYYVIPRIFAG